MILLDTNVILALLSPEERERRRVLEQWSRIRKQRLVLVSPVVIEVTHFLHKAYQLSAFSELMDQIGVEYLPSENVVAWPDVVQWMMQYQQHEPDYADAHLVLLSAAIDKAKVWTNDSEFRTIWRRPDGSPVPLAIKG